MPTNNLSPKSKNKLGIASSIPPKMSERFGSAVLPYLQSVQGLFPPTNPYGQATSNFLLGQAPQAAQRMAEGYPNVLFNTSNPLGGNRIVNPVALDMAVALPIGTALKGAGLAGGGVAATFAGIGAKTANREALLVAERMKAAGAPDEEIYKATGWFFGSADGKPRFEIPDDQTLFHKLGYKEPTPEQARQAILDDETLKEIAAIKQPLIDSGTYDIKKFYDSNPGLYEKFITARNRRQAYDNQINPAPITRATEQFVSHDKLFDAYPDTADIPLRYNINHSGGAYYDNRNSFLIGGGNERSTTLHELQHAVQQREKFAKGGSPEGLPEALGNDAKALRTKANQLLAQGNRPEALALEKQARQLDSQIVWGSHAPQELYRRLAGESEARLTQSRMTMTGAERAASYPPSMYDVPVGDQIVRYGDGAALATTPKVEADFSGTKILDAEGKPLVVYHGTDDVFDTFNPKLTRDIGSHFGAQEQAVKFGKNIMPVYLNIRNPLPMDDVFSRQDGLGDAWRTIDAETNVTPVERDTLEQYKRAVDNKWSDDRDTDNNSGNHRYTGNRNYHQRDGDHNANNKRNRARSSSRDREVRSPAAKAPGSLNG